MVSEQTVLDPEKVRSRMESSYAEFCRLLQDDGWFDPMHEKLCNFIQYHIEAAAEDNRDCKIRLTMPRGSLKTTIVTKYLPAWLASVDPSFRSLIVTNTMPNARKKLDDIRGIFTSHVFYKAVFPDRFPALKHKHSRMEKRWNSEAAELDRGVSFPEATFEAAGVGTKKTGSHYNLIIEDDTVAPDESEMKGEVILPTLDRIEKAIGYHKQTTALLIPRVFEQKVPRIRIVVSTRWGSHDLISYMKDSEVGWRQFDIPAVRGADAENWEEGTPVFSMFYSKDELREIEQDVGPFMFRCLYLNKPQDSSLRVFKDEWIAAALRKPENMPKNGFHVITVDPAISEKDKACETAITLIYFWKEEGRRPFQLWEYAEHGHFLPSETIERTMALVDEYLPTLRAVVIEDVAFQAALKIAFYDAAAARGISLPIIGFKSRQKKEVRIEGYLAPLFKYGKIFLGPRLPSKVQSQLRAFPTGKLVDLVDAFSFGIKVYEYETAEQVVREKKKVNPYSFEEVLKEVVSASKVRRGISNFYEDPTSDILGEASLMSYGMGDEIDYANFSKF
jgi:hypothetical protein